MRVASQEMLKNFFFEKILAAVTTQPVLADQTWADMQLTQQGRHFPLGHIVGARAVFTPLRGRIGRQPLGQFRTLDVLALLDHERRPQLFQQ